MKKNIILDKKEGETPLECLERFRTKNKKYNDVKMTYAGRLDPMASGLLIVLAGEEVKNKEKYLAFDKEYDFEVLFGFSTDTYDILGKVVRQPARNASRSDSGGDLTTDRELEKQIKNNLKYFTGKFAQEYPRYSSKTVNGKQLFEYAREGVDVEVPSREVVVKQLKFLKLKKINNKQLLMNIEKRIKKVKGDFRQDEIVSMWHKALKGDQEFFIGGFKIKCGSGTYVRGIANSLGEKVGIPALAFSIKRTKIGKWSNAR